MFETNPLESDPLPGDSPGGMMVSPEQAIERLEQFGYTPDTWDQMLASEAGSHFTRALVYIARGNRPQDINEAYALVDPVRSRYTLADKQAAASAQVTWNTLATPSLPQVYPTIKGAIQAGNVQAGAESSPIQPSDIHGPH